MHKHHIMPRHLGGRNDPENLVEVSVAEHAEIHRCLWIYGGRWQDEIAWRSLSKQITFDEARRLAVSRALKGKPSHRRGKKLPKEHIEKIKGKTWKWPESRRNGPGGIPWNKGTKGLQGSGLCNDIKEYHKNYRKKKKLEQMATNTKV